MNLGNLVVLCASQDVQFPLRARRYEKKYHKIKKACPFSFAFLRCHPLIMVLELFSTPSLMQLIEKTTQRWCICLPVYSAPISLQKKTCLVWAALYHTGQLISCDLPVTSCLGLGHRCLHCFARSLSGYLLQTYLHLFTWR